MPRVTVLTPTWNRAATLRRLFASLQAQSYRDFEWLVVDDGSSDATRELVSGWAEQTGFPIRYVHQDNAGKHVALNHGAREARGELCAVIDSDDWYVPEGLARLVAGWDTVPDPASFCEVQGLCADADGRVVGDRFPAPVVDSDAFEMAFVLRIRGDKQGMHRTDVLRAYPFPEDTGSAVVSEALVWNRMARTYRTRYLDEVIAHVEYQPGGLSLSQRELGLDMAGAMLLMQREVLEMGRPMAAELRYRTYANVVRNGLHRGFGLGAQLGWAPARAWWAAALPAGLILHARDRRAVGRRGTRG